MAWQVGNDTNGTARNWYKQEKTQSCGVACAMMIVRLLQNKSLDETTVRAMFTNAEGSVNVGFDGIRNFNQTGTTQSPIIGVLANYKISANQVARDHVGKWIKAASATKPVILGVDWGIAGVGQGGHWVVCLNWPSGGQCVVLDPWYGVVDSGTGLFPVYFARSDTTEAGSIPKGRINDLIQIN